MKTLIAVCAVVIFVGATLIVLGFKIRKGQLGSVHSYHTQRVREIDRLVYGKRLGLGIIVSGLSVVVTGGTIIAANVTGNRMIMMGGLVVLVIGLTVGLMLCVSAQMRYNKGIF